MASSRPSCKLAARSSQLPLRPHELHAPGFPAIFGKYFIRTGSRPGKTNARVGLDVGDALIPEAGQRRTGERRFRTAGKWRRTLSYSCAGPAGFTSTASRAGPMVVMPKARSASYEPVQMFCNGATGHFRAAEHTVCWHEVGPNPNRRRSKCRPGLAVPMVEFGRPCRVTISRQWR